MKKIKRKKIDNINEFKRKLFHPRENKIQLFNHLKADNDYYSFNKIIKAGISHPVTKQFLFANALPKTYNSLRQSKIIPCTNHLEGELAWNIFAIKKYESEICRFVSLKQRFEKAFLLCDYSDAEMLIKEIEQTICCSLWSLENSFLLTEYKNGIESNWKMHSELAKLINEPLLLFFIENFSKKVESRTSYYRYQNLFENQLSEKKAPDFLKEYCCFRMNYPAFIGYKNFPLFLTLESISSIIDRYLIVINILFEISCGKDSSQLDIIKSIIPDLHGFINCDVILSQINNHLFPDNFILLYESIEFLSIIDLYTHGRFDVCIEKIPSLLKLYPTSIEFYEIYTKSLLELDKEFIPTNISLIIDETMLNLYRLYSQHLQNEEAKEKLFKLILSFNSAWSKQLFGLINPQANIIPQHKPHKFLYTVYSNFNNPRILDFYNEENYVTKISKILSQEFGQNKAICVNERINTKKLELLREDTEISEKRKSLYIGRILIKSNRHEEAKNHYERLIEGSTLSASSYEEVINGLFVTYIELKEYRQAVILFVDNYLQNQYLVTKFDKQSLLVTLEKTDCSGLEDTIELPIFYKIVSIDPYEQYVAYDIFVSKYKIQRPSQLFGLSERFNLKKFAFFLREICTSEILHHSIFFEGPDDIEKERASILKELLKIDKENDTLYIQELTEISKRTSIRKTIREVNKGRIIVNVQQLKNIESLNIKEGFNRYRELQNYADQNKSLVAIDSYSASLDDYLKILNEEKNKIPSQVDDPAYISFKVMFLELRDKYIHSKEYGLGGCLSMRIRHGTLENHIRSVFESLNLVSRKDKNGNYHDIEYWGQKLHHTNPLFNKREQIQNAIKQFSKKIDDQIEFIVKELIQVYTEKHTSKPQAMFNYAFSQEYLKLIFYNVKNTVMEHDKFLDYCFRELEEITKMHLEKVRKAFNESIKDSFLNIISEFYTDIKKIIADSQFVDLTSSIIICNTNIQNELINISDWFDFSEPITDIIALKTLVQTSIEITNAINPNYQLSPQICIADERIHFKSNHLIYVIRNLLDNIIKHSSLPANELHVEIKSELIENKILRLTFINNISEIVNKNQLESIFIETQNKWRSHESDFDKTHIEGGSGFNKIRSILLFDIGCKNPDFSYLIQNNNVSIIIDLDPILRPQDL